MLLVARGLAITWHNTMNQVHTKNKAMKTIIIPSQKSICAIIAIALGMLILTQVKAQAQPTQIPTLSKEALQSSIGPQWDKNLEKELAELSQWMQPKPTPSASYKVVNMLGQVVYEAVEPNHLFVTDLKLKQLLRHSDLIVEAHGVKYYLYEGKEMPLLVSQLKNKSTEEKL